MHRRSFVRLLAAAAYARASASLDRGPQPQGQAPPGRSLSNARGGPPPLASLARSRSLEPQALQVRSDAPTLRVVSSYSAAALPGMPGPYPGRVVSIRSDRCVDPSTGAANDEIVREM